jgi:cytochrome bd ubiquinol oxidase subunit I
MTGAVITGSFVMSAVGAFYLLEGRHRELRTHLSQGGRDCRRDCVDRSSSFPPAIMHGKYVARNQPAAIAAMEGFSNRDRRGHGADGPAQRGDGRD